MQQPNYQKKIPKASTETLLGKQLPANIEAEKSVIGAILLNDENFSQVSEILIANDFYHQPHKMIFEVMSELAQKYKRIDLVTLQDELQKKNNLMLLVD